MLELDILYFDIRDIPFDGMVMFPEWYTNNFKVTIGSRIPRPIVPIPLIITLGYTTVFEGTVEVNKEITIPLENLVGEFRLTVSSPDIERGHFKPKKISKQVAAIN